MLAQPPHSDSCSGRLHGRSANSCKRCHASNSQHLSDERATSAELPGASSQLPREPQPAMTSVTTCMFQTIRRGRSCDSVSSPARAGGHHAQRWLGYTTANTQVEAAHVCQCSPSQEAPNRKHRVGLEGSVCLQPITTWLRHNCSDVGKCQQNPCHAQGLRHAQARARIGPNIGAKRSQSRQARVDNHCTQRRREETTMRTELNKKTTNK